MAEATITFDDAGWVDMLAGMKRKMKDVQGILTALFMTIGFKDIIAHFKDEEGPDGQWPRRAASTQERYQNILSGRWNPPAGATRAQFNPSNNLLQMTGRLRGSILPTSVKTRRIANGIVVFSNVKYSAAHDYGDPGRGIPARPFMWLSDDAIGDMQGGFYDMLLGKT